jgi:hypothetical protein
MVMSTDPQRAFVLAPGEGRSIDLGNFAMSVKAAADDTASAFTLLEATEPPGSARPCTFTTMPTRPFTSWRAST